MIILPFLIGIPVYITVGFLVTLLFGTVVGLINEKIYNDTGGFYSGMLIGGLDAGLFMVIMAYVFSWFNYQMPLLFAIIVGVTITLNNLNRVNTRQNRSKEIGFLVGELAAVIGVFVNLKDIVV